MNEVRKSPPVVASVILGSALLLSTACGSFAYARSRVTPYETINVTGSVAREVDADSVKWSVTLSRTVPATSQADAGRQLNADRAVFLAHLSAAGIGAEAVSIQPLSISDVWSTVDYKTGRTAVTGYAATQILVIDSSKVSEVGALAQNASAAMAERDISLSTQGVEYFYEKLGDLKLELLTAATQNARKRGEAILAGGGGTLGRVVSADTGVFQVTAVHSVDLADYGTYDTTSPRKKVTAVVHATFRLE